MADRDEIRPRSGTLIYLDGTTIELRMIPTANPGEFLAVTVDGEPALVRPGCQIQVDVIGPGQSVVFTDPHAPPSPTHLVVELHEQPPPRPFRRRRHLDLPSSED